MRKSWFKGDLRLIGAILCSLSGNLTTSITTFVTQYVPCSPGNRYQAHYCSWIFFSLMGSHVWVNWIGAQHDCRCLWENAMILCQTEMSATCSHEAFETLSTEDPIFLFIFYLRIHHRQCCLFTLEVLTPFKWARICHLWAVHPRVTVLSSMWLA